MPIDPHNLPARLVSLVLAVVMPLCCCTIQTLGAWSLGDAETVAARPSCCCAAATACDDAPADGEPADEGCHCLRAAPVDLVDHTPLLDLLAFPPDVVTPAVTAIAWTDLGVDAAVAPIGAGPPPNLGPPDACPRRLRRAVILQV